ncbi:glycosyltransferase family 4 protein [Marivivens donghaensis]|uniref:glycosyltransferase family 4 protein n=1 Tax=Marivivens donghaensis TaxID=1699413 RepID=UPI00201EF1C5|nr:glycosyltransferase family 1 protein [Marivivens donghaensis]MCL7409362.1 glycosyltransferase family 4 protein [Marivivens donghaensis]MDN3702841.1 glycosyltransferase family 1 protein [Marivivens donghaensis]
MDTIINNASGRVLDITRLVGRAGRVLTGVDRVELAYLRRFLADDVPCYFIARTSYGYVLLDRSGGQSILRATLKGEWGQSDLLSRLRFKMPKRVQAAQSFVRKHRVARCGRSRLALMLSEHLPKGVDLYIVGHTNLEFEFVSAFKLSVDARVHVMIHDTIPLDYPEVQRPQTVTDFNRQLRVVSEEADRVIAVSKVTNDSLTPHLQRHGRVPPIIVAHPGIDPVMPRYAEIPPDLDLSRPYFVTVGTIEPRKYHSLLLEVWESLDTEERPLLLICGNRGWLNQTVFEALDRGVPDVIEVPDLSDSALAAVVHGSKGMLFPSIAEGFGMPPIEAAALGTPVVCADLPVYRETLGDRIVYLDPQDNYSWRETVNELKTNEDGERVAYVSLPKWDDHFAAVLGVATASLES